MNNPERDQYMSKSKDTVSVRLIDLGEKKHTQNRYLIFYTFVAEKKSISDIKNHDYCKISKCYVFPYSLYTEYFY